MIPKSTFMNPLTMLCRGGFLVLFGLMALQGLSQTHWYGNPDIYGDLYRQGRTAVGIDLPSGDPGILSRFLVGDTLFPTHFTYANSRIGQLENGTFGIHAGTDYNRDQWISLGRSMDQSRNTYGMLVRWKKDFVHVLLDTLDGPTERHTLIQWGSQAENQMRFQFNSNIVGISQSLANVLVLDPAERVGVNTTSPLSALDVNGNLTLSGASTRSIGMGQDGRLNLHPYGSALKSASWIELYGQTGAGNGQLNLAGKRLVFLYDSDTTSLGSTGMTLDSTGFLGIGTESPEQRLDVYGNFQLSGGTNRTITRGADARLNLHPNGTAASSASWIELHPLTGASDGQLSLGGKEVQVRYGSDTSGQIGNIGLLLDSLGNLGVGVTTPASRLDVNGDLALSSPPAWGRRIFTGQDVRLNLYTNTTSANSSSWIELYGLEHQSPGAAGQLALGGKFIKFFYGSDTTSSFGTVGMLLDSLGNVAIGTMTPAAGYKLTVDGFIKTKKLLVSQLGWWPDFVFEESYHLRPLSEVETFIQRNKHLPDIAPASEVTQEGVDVAEMQALLLQKIEELTLYIIEQEKRIVELENQGTTSK